MFKQNVKNIYLYHIFILLHTVEFVDEVRNLIDV